MSSADEELMETLLNIHHEQSRNATPSNDDTAGERRAAR